MADLRVIFFTGVSGAGKTTALHAVEDLGFYCTDNLPIPLLEDYIAKMREHQISKRAALVVDSRVGNYIQDFVSFYPVLKASGVVLDLVYLDAGDDVLVRRFSQTRRPHHLAAEDLRSGIIAEREIMAPVRAQATTCLDTSTLSQHELRRLIQDRYETGGTRLTVTFLSFGFRHGLPAHADLVFDVRFLPNPFWVEELRHQTGRDQPVADYVLQQEPTRELLRHVSEMIEFLLPRYEEEGKVYLTVAVGCTGGHHRSVAIAEELGRTFGARHSVKVRHRDIDS